MLVIAGSTNVSLAKNYVNKEITFSNVADGVLPMDPNPTPTARPSGILCTVIAIIRRRIRLHESINCVGSTHSGTSVSF